jgi:hypothetical protein
MKPKKNRTRRKHTAKIYYGPDHAPLSLYWKVRVIDAAQEVKITGSLIDAVMGRKGVTVGCHLSNCAMRNAGAFPHKCMVASFTRTTALIVTEVRKGSPSKAIRYKHGYAKIVDLNDRNYTKIFAKQHPEYFENQPFVLSPPRKTRAAPKASIPGHAPIKASGRNIYRIPRGALNRAQKAGLVSYEIINSLAA